MFDTCCSTACRPTVHLVGDRTPTMQKKNLSSNLAPSSSSNCWNDDTHLRERQLLGAGATLANALLDDAHGKPPMGHTLCALARITVLCRQMRVHAMQQQFEAFGRIAEATERKPAAGQRTGGERPSQWFRTQSRFGAGLQLLEEFLRMGDNGNRWLGTIVKCSRI